MRISLVYICCFICIGILSCSKKKPSSESSPIAYPDYTKLSIGNYWIYQEYIEDSLGASTPTTIYDSMYVEKDTVINNDTFFKIVSINSSSSSNNSISFQRVIEDRLVNEEGRVLFSSTNFTEPTYSTFILGPDTICEYVERMVDKNQSTIVPAGTFITSNMQYQYLLRPAYSFYGQVRNRQNRYAKDIGLVKQTLPFYLSISTYKVKKLVRYHLN